MCTLCCNTLKTYDMNSVSFVLHCSLMTSHIPFKRGYIVRRFYFEKYISKCEKLLKIEVKGIYMQI